MAKKIIHAKDYNISNQLVSHDAVYVIEKLQKHGFDGYIVGGGIRDLLLGKRPKDFDVVTNATPELICKIFKRNSMIIGRRFKIAHVIFNNINPEKMVNQRPIVERHIIEISTYRSMQVHEHSLNEHGKIMRDNNYGTQAEDANRRDFTINALFYDPIKEVIIDYHNGIKDIINRQLCIIGNPSLRFAEDPVRMLRAIRLAIKLDLTIDSNINECFKEMKHLLNNEHKSRLYEEMLKILLSGYAKACIDKLTHLPLPKQVFPLFDKLFFKAKPNQFALKVIEKTDSRLKETSDISIIFILSSLLWNIVDSQQKKLHDSGLTPMDSLLEATTLAKEFAQDVGIPRHTYNNMCDLWLLQLEFDSPSYRKIKQITTNSRFRQAWHLYTNRHEFGQVNNNTFNWWNSYIEADNDEKILLLNTLKHISSDSSKEKQPQPKKRKINKIQ